MEEDGRGSTSAVPTPSRRELKLCLPRPLDPVSLSMSKEDLSRARTAMEIHGYSKTPRFLVDKPLDVWMYTPERVSLYT